MSKISSIYNSTKILYRDWKRKGKTKKSIEDSIKNRSGDVFNGKGMGKIKVANKKINQYFDDIKKLSNEERLERIKRKKWVRH